MRTEYSLVDSERIVDNLGNQGTVWIAKALIVAAFWTYYRAPVHDPILVQIGWRRVVYNSPGTRRLQSHLVGGLRTPPESSRHSLSSSRCE